MTTNPYPHLGFNPVPGVPDDVTDLTNRIKTATEAVRDTSDLLFRLRNSNDEVWRGEAGDAFRSHFDATLAQDLGYAQKSLERAVTLLGEWNTALIGFRDQAKALDQEAATAADELDKAILELQRANANPDLGLANQQFDDPAALQAAQNRLNAATARVNTASAAVDHWMGIQDSIRARAHDLETEHGNVAKRIAAELDAAAKDFAPSEPDKSIWERITDAVKAIGDWIDEHREGIHTALGIVSAASGLLALCTPPPISAIALGVALAASAGALTLDLTDDQMRQDLMSLDPKAWLTLSGDALGAVPGVSGLGKTAWAGLTGADEAGRLASMATAWKDAAHDPGLVAKILTDGTRLGAKLDSSGITGATHRILQATGGATAPSDAGKTAIAGGVLSRAGSTVLGLLGLAVGG
ncbi:hypothetical protein [Nocardia paucivorans]|uniref:hypothetical protein n=1 Tax=Nocardia paucivorans TaxID=114259 RepID=UPI0002EF205B|nr:hypothetical protein [Nocardia paucivorans]